MNPWGVLLIALGALAIYIGVRGTQNSVYAFIFGHAVDAYNNTPFAPSTQGDAPGTTPDPTQGSHVRVQ